MFKIITIPYDPAVRGFDDELLNKFLVNKQVKSYQAELITANGDPAWTVFIEYELVFEKPSAPPPKSLDKQQQLLFDRLKTIRGHPLKDLSREKTPLPGKICNAFLLGDLLTDWLKRSISPPIFSRTSVAERLIDPHQSPIRIKALVL